MKHFYVSLRSDASTNVYPSNTSSKFVTGLSHINDLKGEWEVALNEIDLPCIWNIRGDDYWFRWNDQHIRLQDGHYDSVMSVLTDMVKRINRASRRDWPKTCVIYSPDSWWRDSECDLNIFLHGPNLVYFEFRSKKPERLQFSPALANMLGLEKQLYLNPDIMESSRPSQMHVFTTAFIYTDIIQPVTVGDTKVQLLRSVVLNNKHKDHQLISYDSPIYVPVKKNSFQSIEVNIMSDVGESLSFGVGKSSLLLHFRRIS